jgi:hypothetical protein
LSNKYSEEAKNLIVYYYKKWFGGAAPLAYSMNKFLLPSKIEQSISAFFTGTDPKEDFQILKKLLKNYGHSIPILFKQYTELCVEGGISFSDFGIDSNFQNCIDAFIFVKLEYLKETKKRRYLVYEKELDLVDDF